MTSPTSTRRSFLRRGAAALAATVAVGASARSWRAVVAIVPTSLDVRLAGLLGDRAAAVAIGRVAAVARPVDELVAAVASRLVGGTAAAEAASDARLRAEVARAVHEDFVAGDTVSVDGWVLARTEVELCALALLVAR